MSIGGGGSQFALLIFFHHVKQHLDAVGSDVRVPGDGMRGQAGVGFAGDPLHHIVLAENHQQFIGGVIQLTLGQGIRTARLLRIHQLNLALFESNHRGPGGVQRHGVALHLGPGLQQHLGFPLKIDGLAGFHFHIFRPFGGGFPTQQGLALQLNLVRVRIVNRADGLPITAVEFKARQPVGYRSLALRIEPHAGGVDLQHTARGERIVWLIGIGFEAQRHVHGAFGIEDAILHAQLGRVALHQVEGGAFLVVDLDGHFAQFNARRVFHLTHVLGAHFGDD